MNSKIVLSTALGCLIAMIAYDVAMKNPAVKQLVG